MTKINATHTRGFFDPITLGMRVPHNFTDMVKYQDDVTTITYGTFIHELTHYLQFYGSAFGIAHLLSLKSAVHLIEQLFKTAHRNKREIRFPFVENSRELLSEVDSDLFFQAKLGGQFFMEEVFGYTYSLFGTMDPIKNHNNYVFTSTFYLQDSEFNPYPVTGEMILENNACSNEITALNNHWPAEQVKKFISEQYYSLSKNEEHKYAGISTWLLGQGLLKLEPIIYFIVLNQPVKDVLFKIGNYNLVSDLKKIFYKWNILKDIQFEYSNESVRNVIEQLCSIAELKNPFTVMERLLNAIETISPTDHDSISWISKEVLKWTLKNPVDAIYWPKDFRRIANKIPIYNIRFTDHPDDTLNLVDLNGLYEDEFLANSIRQHHEYCERIHIYYGLFNSTKIVCPKFNYSAPKICNSCEKCGGILPNTRMENDCPVYRKYPFIKSNNI